MGIDLAALGNNIWVRMIETDRKKFPRRMRMTEAERQDKQVKILERKIHNQFTKFCDRNGIWPIHSDPTRKASIRAGSPDYVCWRDGKAIAIEFKVYPRQLTTEQENVFAKLQAMNNTVITITEAVEGEAYREATRLIKEFFNLADVSE